MKGVLRGALSPRCKVIGASNVDFMCVSVIFHVGTGDGRWHKLSLPLVTDSAHNATVMHTFTKCY